MVTRLGLYGGPRKPYGSFAGKVEQAPEGVKWSSNYDLTLDIIL